MPEETKNAAESGEWKLVPMAHLKKWHRDLDACQKVMWLRGGFDPAYCMDAQDCLKEMDSVLDAPAPPAGGVQFIGYPPVPEDRKLLAVGEEADMTVGDKRNPFHNPAIADGYASGWNSRNREVTRLQAENAALQQRLNVADQRVDELSAALVTCSKWFTKHSPTAPLIGGFGDAEHPMIIFIRGALSAPAAKVDCGNCAFVHGVCSTGCETQRIRADQQ